MAASASHQRDQAKPALPPPQTFDILPVVHELLARIDHRQDLLDPAPDSDAADLGSLYADLPPLEPKDLPTEVLQVKAKIRKALKELEKLPDMERSIADQEEEIKELEEREKKQREVLKQLQEWGAAGMGKLG